ncbi:MAG TPA: FGGY family carbohydrate kinase, partial [Abditibacteriaceae bacterium]|nr:FGGY family carbohydrate kinase [Abditibacteriaceae bacterium]
MNPDSSATVLALDVGTSSTRAILFDAQGDKIGAAGQIEYSQSTTFDGGVETDADALLEHTAQCIDALLKTTNARPVAVACSCFWHSLMAVDEHDRPLTPLFSWADNRAAPWIPALRATLDEEQTHARTGCVFHTSYWPAKLLWLHHTRPELFSSSTRSRTRWIGFGEYLALKLCGQSLSSLSMASGTGVFNQNNCDWD